MFFRRFQTVTKLWTTGILTSNRAFYSSFVIVGGALTASIAHPEVHSKIAEGAKKAGAWLKTVFPPAKPSNQVQSSPSQSAFSIGWASFWGQFKKICEEVIKWFKESPKNIGPTLQDCKDFLRRLFQNKGRFKEWLRESWEIIKNLVTHFRELSRLFTQEHQRTALFNLFKGESWNSTKKFLEVLSGARTFNSPFEVEDGALSVFIAEFLKNPETAVTKFENFAKLVKDMSSAGQAGRGFSGLNIFGGSGGPGGSNGKNYRITKDMIRGYMNTKGELGRMIFEWGSLFNTFVFPIPDQPNWLLPIANFAGEISEKVKDVTQKSGMFSFFTALFS